MTTTKDSAPNAAAVKPSAAQYCAAVPCDEIKPAANNRDRIDPERVKALAASIVSDGLLQPVVLRKLAKGFELIAGEHRWRAHLFLKRPTIAAQVYTGEEDLGAARKKAVENFQRVDLTPIEEARKYRELMDLGMKQKEIGELLGKSQPVVANMLRLLELPKTVQELIGAGKLSAAHGVSLVRFARWPKACELIAENVLQLRWSSKDLDRSQVPFLHVMKADKLGVHFGKWDGYVVTPEMKQDPDYIDDFCFDYKKGMAEKARQDATRKKKQALAEKQEDGKQSKLTPGEKAKRAKVIAENKQARAESSLARTAVMEQLRATKAMDNQALVVVLSSAFHHHYKVGEHVEAVANQLGIPLGKDFDETNLDRLAKLKPHDALRLVAGCILDYEAECAVKRAHEIPAEVAHVLGAKKTAALKSQAAAGLAAAKKGGK